MSRKETIFYQIRNMPTGLHKGIKVASAIEGVPMWKWIVRVLSRELKQQGIIVEEGD